MRCTYHLRTVRFGTWFTPLLEGSFIAECKETKTDLHLAENRWLPPHRVLFYFPKILVPNLTTKTNDQALVKNYRWSSQAIAAETSLALWCDAHHHSVGSQGLVIRCWGWALAAAAWGVTAEGRGAAASEAATHTHCRHCRWKVWFWPELKSWTQWVGNFIKCGQEMGITLRNINFSKRRNNMLIAILLSPNEQVTSRWAVCFTLSMHLLQCMLPRLISKGSMCFCSTPSYKHIKWSAISGPAHAAHMHCVGLPCCFCCHYIHIYTHKLLRELVTHSSAVAFPITLDKVD